MPVFLPEKPHGRRSLEGPNLWSRKTERLTINQYFITGFPGGTSGKDPACQCRRCKRRSFDPSLEDPLVEGIATHTSNLAWRIPWTEKPGGLQSLGSKRAGHDWSNLACMHIQQISDQRHSNTSLVIVVLLLSHVQLFVTPWTAAHQASVSIIISPSLLLLSKRYSLETFQYSLT